MKKLNYQFILLFTLLIAITITAQDFRRYGVKSGIIEYKLSGDASGTTTTTWDDWGRKEIQLQDTKTTILGMTTEESKTTLMLGTDVYTWKKDENQIHKTKNPIADILGKEDYNEKDLEGFSEKSLKSLGYKKTGEESIDGKQCDVYEGIAGKLWIWKKNKLALKVDVSLLGMSIITEATKINLDVSVDASLFELPKGMEIVKGQDITKQQVEQSKAVQNVLKDFIKNSSTAKNESLSNDSNKTVKESDDNFTEELVEEAKDAAVEGAKEGTKEVVKEEAKKEVKKKVKSLLKSLF